MSHSSPGTVNAFQDVRAHHRYLIDDQRLQFAHEEMGTTSWRGHGIGLDEIPRWESKERMNRLSADIECRGPCWGQYHHKFARSLPKIQQQGCLACSGFAGNEHALTAF
jgi:hypothetical protein